MILLLDNYDSFTYNLMQYLAELGAQVQVYRNDAITVKKVQRMRLQGLTIVHQPTHLLRRRCQILATNNPIHPAPRPTQIPASASTP